MEPRQAVGGSETGNSQLGLQLECCDVVLFVDGSVLARIVDAESSCEIACDCSGSVCRNNMTG
jgi:hypothetical protein